MLPRCAMFLGVLLLVLCGAAITSATLYHVTDLAPLAGDVGSYAMAIADVGGTATVLGRSYAGTGGISTPVTWNTAGTPTSFLASLPRVTSGTPRAIDGNGDIAGVASVGGVSRAFYLPSGASSATILPVLGTTGMNFTSGAGVNHAGQVVGVSSCDTDSGNYHAYVWTAGGGMVDLGAFPGAVPNTAQYSLSSAAAINQSGQIVGMSYTASGSYDPAMWTYNGSSWTITNLNPTHSVCHGQSSAYAVNQYGDAVGSGFAAGGIMPTTNAILYQHDGTVVVLPGLGNPAPSDSAQAINSFGMVVGRASVAGVGYRAFVYDSSTGVEQDLNNLLVPDGSGTGWTLQYAYGIDDAGRIAGYGPSPSGGTHAFLLTPVLPGDANADGKVDISDLSKVLTNYDKNGLTWTSGDFTGDGIVDISDLSILLANYDKSIGAGAAPGVRAVPEPGMLTLLVVALAGLSTRVWRRR
jgi:probable HAF family extracellular repeat protein